MSSNLQASRRLFFALWPTDHLRRALAADTAEVIKSFHCQATAIENFHVTLAFLGAVEASRVAEVTGVAREVRVPCCELHFDHLMVWKRSHVLALVASRIPDALQEFVQNLRSRLIRDGFKLDDEPYRPHVTLAREVRAPAMEKPRTMLVWPISDFVLVESTRRDQGIRYEVIERFC